MYCKTPRNESRITYALYWKETILEVCIFTEENPIIGDIANSEVRYLKGNETISFKESRNDFYLKELEHFFDILEGSTQSENDMVTTLRTLQIAKEGK